MSVASVCKMISFSCLLTMMLSMSLDDAVAAKSPATSVEEPAKYTENKPNIIVSADKPVFVLRLKSNPTTGYSWFLREYDTHLMEPLGHSFEPPKKALIGAAGFEDWTFKVKSVAFAVPQQTIIRMVYARPWDSNDNSTQVIFRVSTQ